MNKKTVFNLIKILDQSLLESYIVIVSLPLRIDNKLNIKTPV